MEYVYQFQRFKVVCNRYHSVTDTGVNQQLNICEPFGIRTQHFRYGFRAINFTQRGILKPETRNRCLCTAIYELDSPYTESSSDTSSEGSWSEADDTDFDPASMLELAPIFMSTPHPGLLIENREYASLLQRINKRWEYLHNSFIKPGKCEACRNARPLKVKFTGSSRISTFIEKF